MADDELGMAGRGISIADNLRDQLAQAADGDGRRVLNLLEIVIDLADSKDQATVDETDLAEVLSGTIRRFDKGGEAFYDQISALHKCVRGSAPDAALYWLCRMLDGGVDPVYLLRRVVRMAAEDIGNADPRGLRIALDAWEAFDKLGTPEGELAIAQAVVYLASAPKSNAVYVAYKAAMQDAKNMGSAEVPVHLRNAPTKLMKELGYGKEYRYAHDEPDAYAAGEQYFPDSFSDRQYYHPVSRGLEIQIGDKLARLRALDKKAK
jgi:putative ATPase